jgi:hypothetical protein
MLKKYEEGINTYRTINTGINTGKDTKREKLSKSEG